MLVVSFSGNSQVLVSHKSNKYIKMRLKFLLFLLLAFFYSQAISQPSIKAYNCRNILAEATPEDLAIVGDNAVFNLEKQISAGIWFLEQRQPVQNGQSNFLDLQDGLYRTKLVRGGESGFSQTQEQIKSSNFVEISQCDKVPNALTASPNPASDEINVDIGLTPISDGLKLEVRAPSSKLVSEENVVSKVTKLKVGDYPAGVYFIFLIGKQGTISRTKIFISK